ncbi:MAG: TetR/AcrR family transcriptional regulator [Alphaproteobacteria bacterium]|nr:TetR/AcrR family transcriptional regulator [Alphaproteobacteria bacterium]MDE2495945.1 TetR/AcrR family transcriptional regulator [Alphaproteobacteria bacterium]
MKVTELPGATDDPRAGKTHRKILEAAARQFSACGFHGANMRDVAADAGILVGSIYYHFESKEALFVAVHGAAVELMIEAVCRAIQGITDPWERLEKAAAAHCEILNGDSPFVGVIAPIFPAALAGMRSQLTAQRDTYESIFKELVPELGLDPDIDPKVFRLHFLAALNGTKFWYGRGDKTPSEVGRQLVQMLKRPLPDKPAGTIVVE